MAAVSRTGVPWHEKGAFSLQTAADRGARALHGSAPMLNQRARTLHLLSVLVAGAALAPLTGCGGKTSGDGTSSGSGADGTSSGSGGKSGGESGTGADSPGAATPSDCGRLVTTTSNVDPDRCEAQVASTTRYTLCGGGICSWSVERPCKADAGRGEGDAATGSDAGDPDDPCSLCSAGAPKGAPSTTFCRLQAPDGGGAVIVSCGGCGVGRPPKGFVARDASASSKAGEWLARMAQLEAASVHAFLALRDDLARLGAPAALLRDLERAADDEVRHARVVRRQAERQGAVVPEVGAIARRPRSLEEIAIENVEEGCVNETFGAVVAAMQAKDASDASIKRMMGAIAREELQHAALSWRVAAWIEPRLETSARARVDEARRGALAALDAELAKGGEGLPSLGLPDAARARAALEAIRPALESGDLGLAA